MYLCIHIHMYMYMCIYICVYLYIIHLFMYLFIFYMYIYVCVYIYIYICISIGDLEPSWSCWELDMAWFGPKGAAMLACYAGLLKMKQWRQTANSDIRKASDITHEAAISCAQADAKYSSTS